MSAYFIFQDLIGRTPSPVVLVDMGSSNCEKSRIFIDAILDQQVKLNFVPVDISQGLSANSIPDKNERHTIGFFSIFRS